MLYGVCAAVEPRPGDLVDPRRWRTYLEEWLWGKQSLRPSTHASYETHVRRYLVPYLGKLRLDGLRPVHIERMYRESWPTRTTGAGGRCRCRRLRRIHATLMSALNTAVRRGLIDRNPAATVELPRVARPRVETWTAAELAEFLRRDQRATGCTCSTCCSAWSGCAGERRWRCAGRTWT